MAMAKEEPEDQKYRVVRRRSWAKWVSEIREPKKRGRIWLGSFSTPEMAARAHDAASLCLKGLNAKLNFPDFPYQLPIPYPTSTPAIQEAALAAALAPKSALSPGFSSPLDRNGHS